MALSTKSQIKELISTKLPPKKANMIVSLRGSDTWRSTTSMTTIGISNSSQLSHIMNTQLSILKPKSKYIREIVTAQCVRDSPLTKAKQEDTTSKRHTHKVLRRSFLLKVAHPSISILSKRIVPLRFVKPNLKTTPPINKYVKRSVSIKLKIETGVI